MGDGLMMQYADDLLNCTLEAYMGLSTNVTPINSIQTNNNKIGSGVRLLAVQPWVGYFSEKNG